MNPATNRTEFARFMDREPGTIPEWEKFRSAYFAKKHHRGPQFGQYMRSLNAKLFVEQYYRYWLKHPELWDGGYLNKDALAHELNQSRSVA